MDFCSAYVIPPLPAGEDTIVLFISYLDQRKLSGRSTRVYLSALRSLHLDEGFAPPCIATPRIKRMLRAMDISGVPPRQKLPITLDILSLMLSVMPPGYDGYVFKSAMSLAFFGCLRAAELCVTGHAFDPLRHLTLMDVQVVALEAATAVKVCIKRSKTDHVNQGFSVTLKCISTSVCAHCALLNMHFARHQSGLSVLPTSPLFLFGDASYLTKFTFVKQTRYLLQLAGFDPDGYSGHSFRAGCATSAAQAGFSDWEIQLLGRWSSSAYHRYIRASPSLLASLAHRLATQQRVPQQHPACTSTVNMFQHS